MKTTPQIKLSQAETKMEAARDEFYRARAAYSRTPTAQSYRLMRALDTVLQRAQNRVMKLRSELGQ